LHVVGVSHDSKLFTVICKQFDYMFDYIRHVVYEEYKEQGFKYASLWYTTLGNKYVVNRAETTQATSVFFILSPGVDPLKDVEKVGKTLGFTTDNKNFHNVSLGQGQEVVAEAAMELAAREGHWVVLQNINLVAKWLSTLEKDLERYAESAHENFRMFISAGPSKDPDGHNIPQGILETAIKISNKPPTGMQANLHKALDNFSQDTMEMYSKENEFKSILFAKILTIFGP
jgi:dynein heavy chain, axonemal